MMARRMEVVAMMVVVFVVVGMVSEVSASEATEYVSAHNKVRSKVDVAALEWSDELAAYARRYGEKQRDEHQCAMVHSQGDYGENLFWGYGKRYGAADAVRSWEKESDDYDYESNKCAPGKVCGHYTQLVWADTKKVGCATIACHDGATFIICSYDPPGNFVGERPYQRTGVKPAQNASPARGVASAVGLHHEDDGGDDDFNRADAKLCQCMLSCVSQSRSNQWRHDATAQ